MCLLNITTVFAICISYRHSTILVHEFNFKQVDYSSDDQFQAMCDQIQQKFKYSDPPSGPQKWEKGQACVAFYGKDQTWHRAAIVKVEPDKVQVV